MRHLFKPERIKEAMLIVATLLVVKFLWVVVAWIWLPATGVAYSEEQKIKNLYYRVKIASHREPQPLKEQKSVPEARIDDIDLLAIYSTSDTTVVTVRHKGKTSVLSRGESINGFVVEGAGSDFAIFAKEEKRYRVTLLKPNRSSSGTGSITTVHGLDVKRPKEAHNTQGVMPLGEIVDVGDRKIIDRSLLTHYTTNMDDIFKDIGIQDMKKGDTVTGFKISFIRRGSHFSKLGLQKGDIIQSVNGQKINSYNAAFGIFKEVHNMANMTLVIIRNNKEMELEYEVH